MLTIHRLASMYHPYVACTNLIHRNDRHPRSTERRDPRLQEVPAADTEARRSKDVRMKSNASSCLRTTSPPQKPTSSTGRDAQNADKKKALFPRMCGNSRKKARSIFTIIPSANSSTYARMHGGSKANSGAKHGSRRLIAMYHL